MHSFFINREIDRILAIALLLVGLAACFVFVKYAYLERLVDLNHEIEFQQKKNAKIDSILANEKDIRIGINRQKSNIRRNKIFLDGRKSATAVTELQNNIKRLIGTGSGANIQSIKPYPVLKYDDYSEASLEIRIRDIGHQGLQRVLYEIESHSPVLLIKELDIKFAQQRYSTLVEEDAEQRKLSIIMVVSGFFRENVGGL